jgi:hypothetical protein
MCLGVPGRMVESRTEAHFIPSSPILPNSAATLPSVTSCRARAFNGDATMKRTALGIGAALAFASGAAAQSPTIGQPDPRAAIFVQRGCNACHGVWALGVKPKSDAAPDLTFAYVDVVNRYGMSLEAFLYDPRGVMRLMLASHLHLTAADRDSIAHVLKAIYLQHRTQLDEEIPPIAPDSSPPN